MKKIFLFLLVFLLVSFFCVLLYFYVASQSHSSDDSKIPFVINRGDGLKSISQRLKDNNLIKDRLVFIVSAHVLGLNDKLQAGNFQLSSNMTSNQIIYRLSSGGNNDYWVKLVEGWRNEEIATYFQQKNIFDPKYFLIQNDLQQGYIFPDSYLVPIETNTDDFLQIVSKNFNKKLQQASQDPTISLSPQESIILASILEREARTLKSKQEIAGILLNRLSINMALQVDATVQYARDSGLPKPEEYWKPIKKTDLQVNSPYNTYIYTNLPPSPICNPGYDSLYASFHPIESDYLYYITGKDGNMYYAKTLEEHNINIANYLR
ncbi:endolytic transglycosylase MltG [Patescibacteria group bacterium]|nr:endolytic transglycosylase MltG [Patescibacteria group bacterium]MCG2702465.1 endolytic transglycosylase MltG [Candidatus Parcubacteria bacterium]MBU4264485.1 endolytic transglycosylase MltG [Patescibacteria group bacterium]MBU4390416.1 endolytic transglycosylase MltG [Patescibacteria group bacterium]MBU4396727.1 endolytic transglycosylase MltG [Patescibacteria group bacterium]